MTPKYTKKFPPARMVSLSDGVFSIVLTLLVFALQPPDARSHHLIPDLWLRPQRSKRG